MSLVVKVPLILVATVGAWYALTPPQPPPRTQERVKSGGVERSFGSVVRIHALIWKVCCTAPCGVPRWHESSMWCTNVCVSVLCYCKPPRRACCLCICHIGVVFVVAPLLLPHINVILTASTCLDPDTTPSFRARVYDDGR